MAHTRASCLIVMLTAACGGASGADTSATAATGSSPRAEPYTLGAFEAP